MDSIFRRPAGVKDFLPPMVRRKRQIEKIIYDIFEKWGYEEVITPSFEYLETFLSSNNPGFSERIFKFFDRQGGVLALRPDITTSIARMVATHYSDHRLPLRFCYISNVFRSQEPRKGRNQEFFQVGAELIGVDGIESDVEIILLASCILKEIGIRDFVINIGHMKFLEGLIDETGLEAGERQEIVRALCDKNFVLLENKIKELPAGPHVKKLLLSLSRFFGGSEVLLSLNGCALNDKCRNALHELTALAEMLRNFKDIKFTFDLSLSRGMDYYTGIVFEIYSPGSGFPLGGGGRYDNLMDKFNGKRPATGFALAEEALLSTLKKDALDLYKPYYLFYDRQSFLEALKKAEELREKGYVVKLIPSEKYRENLLCENNQEGRIIFCKKDNTTA
ncbi:ATP phosphoribosyltransferase regulatory subunit [Thermoanaerobacterium sp. DL9XJH110]|uniref:ATP phosphoribosyltransferase regulatory subunit n=1 Tax=Thermoanaerobacterium sp. DL9XJH110 TaxID=3386643 RepID=UPI003BB6DFB6